MKLQRQVQIKLDNPCTEDFKSMPATSCGRYCGVCKKEVIDFSNLTDAELLQWLKKYPLSCGIFNVGQVNQPIAETILIPERRGWRVWAAILTFASFFTVREVEAQTKIPTNTAQTPDTNAKLSITPGQINKMGIINPEPTIATGGVSQANEDLKIGGARTEGTLYIIDGIVINKPHHKKPGIFKRSWAWVRSRF